LAIYKYSPDALIDDIEILTNEKGGSRAYIHARGDVTPEQIQSILRGFEQRGWFGVPIQHKGRAVLELRGFHKIEELTRYLSNEGLTTGAADVQQTKDDHQGFWDKFKSATLKYTGWAYILGDTAFMTYAGMEQYKYQKKLGIAEKALSEGKNTKQGADAIKALEQTVEQAKEGVRGGRFKLLSGLGYAAGSLVLAGYGSRDQSHIEIQKSVQKVERFLKAEGLTSPDSQRTLLQEPEKKNKSLFDHANDTLRRFPSEALNIIYMGVGLALMRSSFKQISKLGGEIKPATQALESAKKTGKTGGVLEELTGTVSGIKKSKREEIIDVGLGTITASSALAGIAIREKKPVEGQKKREGFAGIWDWIQEQPLRLTGYGYMLATAFHGWATFEKWQPDDKEKQALSRLQEATNKKFIPNKNELKILVEQSKLTEKASNTIEEFKFRRNTLKGRGVFIAANVLAEVLLILSSKGHGEGVRNADVDESVIASTAEYIAKQNPATQEQLVQRLAGYMSSSDVLGMKAEKIASDLRTQISAMTSNPWAQSNPYSAPIAAPEVQNSAAPTTKIHASTVVGIDKTAAQQSQNWKEHVADSKHAAAQPQIA
jgi:hypothetical protein